MSERLVNSVQQAYNNHRAPELWGTLQVSPTFFNRLKGEGLLSAWKYLVEMEQVMGNPYANPELKALANLAGSTLLIMGVRQMSGLSDEELYHAKHVPSTKQKIGEALFNITLGLLFFAQGGGSYHMGYLGKNPSQWHQAYRANLTRAEQERVEREFDPKLDGCQMDTIARIFPDKLRRI